MAGQVEILSPVDSEHDSTNYVLHVHPAGGDANDWRPWCGVFASDDADALRIGSAVARSVNEAGFGTVYDSVRLVKVLGYGEL